MRRAVVVAFAVLASLLLLSAQPAAAADAGLEVAAAHRTDAELSNAAALTNVEVQGSGSSAYVTPAGTYNPVTTQGDGATDLAARFIGDTGGDTPIDSEFRIRPQSDGLLRELTIDLASTSGSDYGFTFDVYLVQETPDQTYGEGTQIASNVDPDFGSGTLTIDVTDQQLSANTDYTIEFVSSGSDNDGTDDVIRVAVDDAASSTWYTSSADGAFNLYGDVSLDLTLETGTYESGNLSAEDVEEGFTNLTIPNGEATVTWLEDADGDGSFTTVTTQTYTSSGNKTVDLSGTAADVWRVRVELNRTGTTDTARLEGDGVLFQAADPDGSNADPTGQISSYDGDISLDVTDSDFGTVQGDSVQVVAENSSGGTIGSTTVSSNGTVTFPYTAPPGQSDITWRLTDSYDGDEVTVSQSFTLPAEVEIRNESNPSQLVTLPNGTVDVRFYFDVGGDPVIVTRNASDGTVNMTGLPANRPFTIVVDGGDKYVNRRIFVESLYERQTVYLLPENESHVPVVFDVADYSGRYDQAESALLVQRAFNGSWGTVQGDLIGANERVSTQLKTDARHRLVIVNAVTGERKVLGPFTPVAASTQQVEITSDGEVSISGLDVMVTISPDIGILAARQTTITGTVRSQNASIANATLTVEYLAPNGTTVLLAEQTATSTGDIQATVDLAGRANGTLRAVTVYNTTAGASGSATANFDIRPATTNQYALLNVLGTIPSMFPAASVEPFQIAISLLLTLAVTAAATAKVPVPTEAVAVFALAQLGMWSVLGWLPYTIPFAAGATAVGLAAIRRGL